MTACTTPVYLSTIMLKCEGAGYERTPDMDRFQITARGPLFFMHIPKTAGMSMRSYLAGQYSARDVCPASTWLEAAALLEPPSSYLLVQGHFYYNMRAALRPGTKAVAVLRDPLLRTLSALRHLKRDPGFHRDHTIAKDLSLRQMLRNPELMARQKNVQAAALCASASFEEVVSFLRRTRDAEAAELEAPATLELSLQRARQVEFLGTVEHLWLLLRQVSEAMGFHPAVGLPLVNDAPDGRTDLADLDENDIELLRRYNDIDLVLYDRCRELIEQRECQRLILTMVAKRIYPRLRGSFAFDLSEPLPGSGWYLPETAEGQVWRWTGPRPQFTLEVSLQPKGRYVIGMRFSRSGLSNPGGLVVRANGRLLDVFLTRESDMFNAKIPLGPECFEESEGYCRLVFDIGEVSTAVGNDLRPLGVAVSRLEFERVG